MLHCVICWLPDWYSLLHRLSQYDALVGGQFFRAGHPIFKPVLTSWVAETVEQLVVAALDHGVPDWKATGLWDGV